METSRGIVVYASRRIGNSETSAILEMVIFEEYLFIEYT